MPKKQKRKALKTALSVKLSEGSITVVDGLDFEKPRTKEMVAFLDGLGLGGKKVLIVTEERNENVYLSARNIPGVDVTRAQDLNTYEVLLHEHILMTRAALERIQEVWG